MERMIRDVVREVRYSVEIVGFFAVLEVLSLASLAFIYLGSSEAISWWIAAVFSALCILLLFLLLLDALYRGLRARDRGGWLRWVPKASSTAVLDALLQYLAYLFYAVPYVIALAKYSSVMIGGQVEVLWVFIRDPHVIATRLQHVLSFASIADTVAFTGIAMLVVVYNIVAAAGGLLGSS